MSKNPTVQTVIHILSYQGERVLGTKWQNFVYNFRNNLKDHGLEDQKSTQDLLIYNYNHPYSAFASLFESLEKAKKSSGWREGHGKVPFQFIFHLEKKDEPTPPIMEPTSNIWDILHQEVLYVTRALKLQWEQLMANKDLPPHSFESEGQGLFALNFEDNNTIRHERLFKHRDLPILGQHKVCYYCGMTTHQVSACPSKFITMKTQGLPYMGYLGFSKLNSVFKEIFTNYNQHVQNLAGGVKPEQIRKNPHLQVLIGFLDIFMVYQLRFLWNCTFTIVPSWDGAYKVDKINIDNQNLHMGLDCLRVGNYVQAEELLENEIKKGSSKKFYAAIGLAFLNLEKGQPKYMAHYFKKAEQMAGIDRELIYLHLLTARFHDLSDNLWKADNSYNSALAIDKNCMEARYGKIQTSVRSGFGEKSINTLRSIINSQQEYFMSVLLDPALIPIQGLVEEMLSARIHDRIQSARENLIKARRECEELETWFEVGAQEIVLNNQMLDNLQKHLDQKSFYGIMDAAERATSLVFSCSRKREEKTDKLKEDIGALAERWKELDRFWKAYNYRPLFTAFKRRHQQVYAQLSEALGLAERIEGTSYRKAVEIVEASEINFVRLEKMYNRMLLFRNIVEASKAFGKNFLIIEIILVVSELLLIPILSSNLDPESSQGLHELMRDPYFQKQVLSITSLFVAPFFALSLTLFRFRR